MRVLVVDDDEMTAMMLQVTLEQLGYEVTLAANGQEAFDRIRTGLYQLVISDWEMPVMSGVELCRQIRARQTSGYTYIILLTSRCGSQNVIDGLNAGADDFVTKPFEPGELAGRLRVGERVLSLESRDITIFTLAKLAESRDPETGVHLERMREYCGILARHLSTLDRYSERVDGDYVRLLYLTSPLHDIGKVGIPDHILLKPGRLTPEEFEIMKQHTTLGYETLRDAAEKHPEAPFLRMARDIAHTHHEKFDGSGYPRGLRAYEIPLCGRIVALADVYDALTTKRIYKPAFDHDRARQIILEGNGSHFDPDVVDAFLATEDEFNATREAMADAVPGEAIEQLAGHARAEELATGVAS